MNTQTIAVRRVCWLGALAAGLLTACDTGRGTGTSSMAVRTPSGDVGAAAEGAGTAGAGGAGANDSDAVECGDSRCAPASVQATDQEALAPCCIDAMQGTCGWLDPSGTCMAPPAPDPDCPNLSAQQRGCCVVETNRCGIDASMFGAGCDDSNREPRIVSMKGAALTCDGEPINAEDSGVAAVGAAGGAAGASGGSEVGGAGSGGAGGESGAGTGGGGGTSGAGRGGIGGEGGVSGAGRGGMGGEGGVSGAGRGGMGGEGGASGAGAGTGGMGGIGAGGWGVGGFGPVVGGRGGGFVPPVGGRLPFAF